MKELKKKLIRNGFSKIASFVLAALTLIFLVMAMTNLSVDKDTAVDLAYNRESVGEYAYIDIKSFDEWACKYDDDTYYVVYDASNKVYNVILTDAQVSKMVKASDSSDEYAHYFNGSYRIYGLVKSTHSKVKSMIEEVYNLESGEYYDYFGSTHLDASENYKTNTLWMWLTFAIFSGLFTLIFGAVWIGQERSFSRENSGYTEEECARAIKLLDETDKKQKVIIDDEFLIGRNNGMLVKYSDILWIYERVSKSYGITTGKDLCINTSHNNRFFLPTKGKEKDQQIADMMNLIAQKNPEVMIGFTDVNSRAYRQMVK